MKLTSLYKQHLKLKEFGGSMACSESWARDYAHRHGFRWLKANTDRDVTPADANLPGKAYFEAVRQTCTGVEASKIYNMDDA